jgi:hypothetical protein
MLFRVSDIKHDRAAGSHARTIQLVDDPITLPDRDSIWRIAEDELGVPVDVDHKRSLGQYVGRFKTEHERQDLSSGYVVQALSDDLRINAAHFSGHRVKLPPMAVSMTHSPALVAGGVTFANTLPWLLFSLPAGALADRVDRRR